MENKVVESLDFSSNIFHTNDMNREQQKQARILYTLGKPVDNIANLLDVPVTRVRTLLNPVAQPQTVGRETCRFCGVELAAGVNWALGGKSRYDYTCKSCTRDIVKAKANDEADRIRNMVLTHYGDGQLKCVQCGFDNPLALCLDHITGGGCRERRSLGGTRKLYFYLVKSNFPTGYQTLCFNCNRIKQLTNREFGRGDSDGK